MVIEAGVVAGYVVAWALRKVRRVGGRLDAEADAVIDASLTRLHEVVAAKLASHPALAELVEEAEATDGGEVSYLARQQLKLELTEAAREDDEFGQVVTGLVSLLRQAEQGTGSPVITGPGSAVFTGKAEAKAEGGGMAFGQVAGGVHVNQGPAVPSRPGRASH
jgi:hypothetical protein